MFSPLLHYELSDQSFEQVAKLSLENLILPIVKKAPHTVFLEGANGQTPFDIIVEKHLEELMCGFLSTYARSKTYPSNTSIVHWPLFAFSAEYGGPTYVKDTYKPWEICREVVESTESQKLTRKLVTREQLDEIAELYWALPVLFPKDRANVFPRAQNKKTQKQPKGNQHDAISLAIYKPGNIYW